MTGARPARFLPAALLVAPLLLAATDAAAQRSNPRFVLATSASSVAEGGSVTVSITCDNAGADTHFCADNLVTGGGSATVTISISGPSGHGAALGSTTAFTYTKNSPWSQTPAGTVTISVTDDNIAQGSRTLTISGAASSYWTTYDNSPAPADITLTLTDNDTAGVTADEGAGVVVTEGVASSVGLTVQLSSEPQGDSVTVAVSSADADECEVEVDSSADYDGGTITFLPSGGTEDVNAQTTLWNNAWTVNVRSVDDALLDGDQTCRVRLDPSSPPPGGDAAYHALSTTTVSVTVADNDVGLSLSPSSISENGGVATVTASLAANAATAMTITLAATPVSPAVAGDYALSSTTLTIASGASSGTQTITAVDNNVDAADKTVTVAATAPSGFAMTPASVTLTIADDDTAGLTLSKTEVSTSEDGTTDMFRVSLATLPSAVVTVAISSSDAGEATVSPASLRFGAAANPSDPAGPVFLWSDPQTVTVTGVDDDDPEDALRRYTITLDPSSPGGSGDADYHGLDDVEVSGTNEDDDAVTVTLSVSAARLAEGESAAVTARLGRSVQAATTITVSAAAGTGASASHFRLSENRTLTVAAGATSSTGAVTITAVDDDVDGPETRQVTVSGSASGGQGALDPDSLTLTIADDDAAPRVVLAVAPATIDESGPENAARVTAALSHPSSMTTTVTVSAAAGVTVGADNVLSIPAGATASADAVTLTAVDDEEQTPDREVAVSGRAENAHGVEQPAAVTLTIRDDDGAEAVTEVLLPAAARAMADSRAGAVRRRLEGADAAGPAEMASLTALLAEHGAPAQDDAPDWKKALAGSSFALPLNAAGGETGSGLAVWGSGDYLDLDGEARGVSWDGEVVSAHLGLDRRLANGLRVGLAASWSEAKFDYGHKNREGEWELEMTSAQPYLGWIAGNGVELWASAGAGSGELEIASGGTRREKSDADMWLAAAGARKPLHETESGLNVSLRGEALYSSFEVDGNGRRIQAYTADASRLRLALEARRDRVLASGARLSPRFELGLRHDGGDGETGAGVELGGGAEYVSGRLTASGGARALVANSDYDEWGADLALAYAPGAGGRGFSFRLAPSWGATQSGTRKLWERGAPGLNGAASESDPGARLEAELGYGLKSPWSRGLLRLTLGGEAVEDADAACRLKGAVALDATASLGLELEVRDPPSGGAERSLMATAELRF